MTPARLVLSASVLGLLSALAAEAAELHGKVLENELGGQPMAAVELTAPGASPTVSGTLGQFRLVLPRRAPGDVVELTVRKGGYQVVNDIQLVTTLLQRPEDRPLTILLCKPEGCEEMRRRFYRLKGVEVVEATYQARLRELEQRNEATVAELKRLAQERDEALAAAEQTADALARERPAEGSAIYQQALRLFLDGRVDEALQALDEGKLQRSLEAARARQAEAEREIEEVTESYLLRGQLLSAQFKFDEAERAYQAAVEAAPESFDANFALAHFAANQKRYPLATAAAQRCLELARRQGKDAGVARTLNMLGVLLSDQNRPDEAYAAYDEALSVRRKLAETNPEVHLPDIAKTLNNLAVLLDAQNRLKEARTTYDEALTAFRRLAETNPEFYLPYVAGTLNNLGLLLWRQNRLNEARMAYDEALTTFRQLAEKDPQVHQHHVASTLTKLGRLLTDQNRLDEARTNYDEALRICRQLAEKNPDVYLPAVANTLTELGILLWRQNSLDEARTAHNEALPTFRQLAAKNPEVYLGNLAWTLNNLGIVLLGQNRPEEARTAFDEALSIRRQLAEENPDAHLPDYAMTLNNLGSLLDDQNRLHEARTAYDEALTAFRRLAETNPEVYLSYVAGTLNNLGIVLWRQKHLDEARNAFSEASTILQQLADEDPERFGPRLTDVRNNLRELDQQDTPERDETVPPL